MKFLHSLGMVLGMVLSWAITFVGLVMVLYPSVIDPYNSTILFNVGVRLLGLIPAGIGFIGFFFFLLKSSIGERTTQKTLYKKLKADRVFSVVGDTLYLKKQCPKLKKLIVLKRYMIAHTSYTPESYTYTSVSGNGMTFGTLRKNSESYGMNARSTNKGEFLFYNPEKNEYCEIFSIVLMGEAGQADRTAIASFVEYDTIDLVKPGLSSTTSRYVNSVSMTGAGAANAMNLFANDMANSRRKLSDLRKIRKWICRKI